MNHSAAGPAGAAFLTKARFAISSLSDAEAATAADAAGEPHGTLRLALPTSFARMWIAPILPDFLELYPNVRIEAELSNGFEDLIANGYDAAIRVGSLPDSSLLIRKIADNKRILCAAPSYLDRRGIPATPDELAEHACLGFTGFARHPNWYFTNKDTKRGMSVRSSGPLTTNDSEALVHAAVKGVGVMMCTEWLVGREIMRGDLVTILDDWAIEDQGAVYCVAPSKQWLASKTRVFLDWTAKHFLPSPPWRR